MTRDEWLKQVQDNPTDWQTVLIFADWLEEQGEELEAEQWRFLVQWCVTHWSTPRNEMHETSLRIFQRNTLMGLASDPHREIERAWCKSNGVRFIRKFPRTLADLETIRSGTH